ncbi:hypothetical protein HDV00_012252 [Rhizophlyctis rosea]|nr:hypothetical protein HDV00_012252 [Rhizophlyctis rosea]
MDSTISPNAQNGSWLWTATKVVPLSATQPTPYCDIVIYSGYPNCEASHGDEDFGNPSVNVFKVPHWTGGSPLPPDGTADPLPDGLPSVASFRVRNVSNSCFVFATPMPPNMTIPGILKNQTDWLTTSNMLPASDCYHYNFSMLYGINSDPVKYTPETVAKASSAPPRNEKKDRLTVGLLFLTALLSLAAV